MVVHRITSGQYPYGYSDNVVAFNEMLGRLERSFEQLRRFTAKNTVMRKSGTVLDQIDDSSQQHQEGGGHHPGPQEVSDQLFHLLICRLHHLRTVPSGPYRSSRFPAPE